jgi:hypothetical protein
VSGEGLAAVIASVATLATALGNVLLQLRQTRKIDENTAVTKDTAAKIEVVHAATTAIVEATGTHQILPHDG